MNISTEDSDAGNRLVAKVCRGVSFGGKDWEFRISRRKLVYREWINSKVLLYSTRNYECIQYLVINHNGKLYENGHFAILNKLTQTVQLYTTITVNQPQ